ncbi:hypothetical protein DRX78_13020 [Salmonella enterica subsp. enterica serovar Oakland]|nr:hypothetical protein [Salmonella enterica]EBX4202691.1 hypothetical protein [Salmonella enterica subsp. enterica serovar Oakland]ECD2968441.1 hypothetical protein [Salmonella enterica subsp. enterica]EBI3714127.1 hypothetical protein [Salmonella enterica]EDX5549189.1 hypothetical protein [Salmonella enterica subsp. enterica serovar Oakland]
MEKDLNPESDDMKFRVVYDGPALERHIMDVKDLAPALISLSDVFDEAAQTVYGKGAKVSIKVNASFKAGSFGIDLIAASSMAQQVIGFFSGNSATAACNLIALLGFGTLATQRACKGLVQLITWIGKRKIKKIHPLPDGNVKIFIDDEEAIFENEVIELYKNFKLRQALENVIAKPLEKEGIDSFGVTIDDGANFVSVTKNESGLFKVDRPSDKILSESVTSSALQLIDISFQEDHKWRFSDGTNTFQASVSDDNFTEAINSQSVNFAKGDLLMVDLKVTQYLQANGIKTTYDVVKVKEIINPIRQIDLPLE